MPDQQTSTSSAELSVSKRVLLLVATVAAAFVLAQCGLDSEDAQTQADAPQPTAAAPSASNPSTTGSTSTSSTSAVESPSTSSTSTTQSELLSFDDLQAPAGWQPEVEDFESNIADMTPVRFFFIDNLLGYTDESLAVANSESGGVYPVGTVVQLFPGEAMVKRQAGFNAATRDWEFFELDVADDGSVSIRVRGGDRVRNRFGQSCAQCHGAAKKSADFLCEPGNGCADLPFPREFFVDLQENDPRPRS